MSAMRAVHSHRRKACAPARQPAYDADSKGRSGLCEANEKSLTGAGVTTFIGWDPKEDTRTELEFAEFIDIIKGATVRSCATSDDFVELGLAEQINVRFQVGPSGSLTVYLVSTLNEGEIPPIRLRIVDDDEPVTAGLVETRIRELRQSYAITYMVRSGRSGELKSEIIRNPKVDIEARFLPEEERLYIAAAAPGSFWLTVLTRSKKAYEAVKFSLALPYKEGRNALLRRVEAETELRELAADEKRLEIGLKRVKGAITTLNDIEKIKDPDIRAAMKKAFTANLDTVDAKSVLALPGPRKK